MRVMSMAVDLAPLGPNTWHNFADLRAKAAAIVAARQNDADLSKKFRTPSRTQIPWAKSWTDELHALTLFAAHKQLADDDTFLWTPDGAVDFEVKAAQALKLQCTMAYPEWSAAESSAQGGYIRHLELKHVNEHGHSFGGGRISVPTARAPDEDLRAWRRGIKLALSGKLNLRCEGCRLLIFAPGSRFNTIDFDYGEVVAPAIEEVGAAAWGRAFEVIYVLDERVCFEIHRPT